MAADDTTHAFLAAIEERNREKLGWLLDEHADEVDAAVEGINPLHLAVSLVTCNSALPAADGGPITHAIVDDLLTAGADPNRRGANGYTPLHTAGFCGNGALAVRLLEGGADPAATVGGVPGSTPLSFALFYAHPSTAAILAAAGRAPDDLRSAAGLDDVAAIERLVGADGALAPGASAGMTFTAPIDAFPPRTGPITDQLTIDEALTWASRNGALAAMQELVERGADVNANPYRGTALLWAVYSDQVEAARYLIEVGADVDLRHDFGGAEHGRAATALHLAAQFGAMGCLEVLLDAGADPSVRDGAFNATPLEWAEHNGTEIAVQRLRR